ncbi:unnamed protein product [Toxocara canis]|uniref:Myelin basic protein n=1 Tax=Toxocara canis TaxID=6265 RepID=A0A183U4L4_TOXCA|nr:unnamed protein product [Toxocara canis]
MWISQMNRMENSVTNKSVILKFFQSCAGDFSEDGFSSHNNRNTFSSSEDDTFSVDKGSLKGCHRSGRKGRTDISKKKTSFSSREFTDESNEEFSQQLKARK